VLIYTNNEVEEVIDLKKLFLVGFVLLTVSVFYFFVPNFISEYVIDNMRFEMEGITDFYK
jgi:multisubunit Na+/H+ antiporter MnhB subunit